jgi:positive regulator of sigma E activity
MNAERLARVDTVEAGHVQLQLAARCSSCSGCGGRCDLFDTRERSGRIALALAQFDATPVPGTQVRLYLPEGALLGHARRGYAVPALGLLLGAVSGHALALSLNGDVDLWAVVFAAAGTLLGIGASKRPTPDCRATPVADATAADPSHVVMSHEDTPL